MRSRGVHPQRPTRPDSTGFSPDRLVTKVTRRKRTIQQCRSGQRPIFVNIRTNRVDHRVRRQTGNPEQRCAVGGQLPNFPPELCWNRLFHERTCRGVDRSLGSFPNKRQPCRGGYEYRPPSLSGSCYPQRAGAVPLFTASRRQNLSWRQPLQRYPIHPATQLRHGVPDCVRTIRPETSNTQTHPHLPSPARIVP